MSDKREYWEASPLRGKVTDHKFIPNLSDDRCAMCGLKHKSAEKVTK